ncbi:hypothetical protein AVEN_5635-1 [Araneus ventricosus]|uniref:Uncharacterized protein n=1 Tax=Araneus ventricosus TaxID=182803 RepID=A0A4Y2ST63_ARAVE|nr:hypothetical protein AVEN_267968-1 [Araneus ventricosus]GBN91532.1 hypothetical protein AVEN_5635-1 [Araneus ventricosus]
MSTGLLVTCILETLPYSYSTSSHIVRNMCKKFHQNRQAYQSAYSLHAFGDFAPPSKKDWSRAYLPLQFFKSANEEPVYQVSSILK